MPLFCKQWGGELIYLLLLVGSPILPVTILLRCNPEITPLPGPPAPSHLGDPRSHLLHPGQLFCVLTRDRVWWVQGGLLPEETAY